MVLSMLGARIQEPLPETAEAEDGFLYQYGLKRFAGNSQLRNARYIGLADPDHAADYRYIGHFIRDMHDPDADDSLRFEGDSLQAAKESYWLPDIVKTASWENMESYYLAILTLSRLAIVNQLFQDRLATQEHLEDEAMCDVTGKVPRAARLGQALCVLVNLSDDVDIRQRNVPFTNNVITSVLSSKGTTFSTAGKLHYDHNFCINMDLLGIPYVLLEPAHQEQVTDADEESYLIQFVTIDRADIKARWLAARAHNQKHQNTSTDELAS